MAACTECGRPVEAVAWALAQKIVAHGTPTRLCMACLARRFRTTEEKLLATARLYRDRGCALFRGLP